MAFYVYDLLLLRQAPLPAGVHLTYGGLANTTASPVHHSATQVLAGGSCLVLPELAPASHCQGWHAQQQQRSICTAEPCCIHFLASCNSGPGSTCSASPGHWCDVVLGALLTSSTLLLGLALWPAAAPVMAACACWFAPQTTCTCHLMRPRGWGRNWTTLASPVQLCPLQNHMHVFRRTGTGNTCAAWELTHMVLSMLLVSSKQSITPIQSGCGRKIPLNSSSSQVLCSRASVLLNRCRQCTVICWHKVPTTLASTAPCAGCWSAHIKS